MALSAFDDRSSEPRADEVTAMLGRSSALWDRVRSYVAEEHSPTTEEWGFAGAKYGWSLRLRSKKRVVVYLTPCRKHVLVGLVLGDRAVRAARVCDLSVETRDALGSAPRYGEGTGLRLEMRYARHAADVEQLIACKMALTRLRRAGLAWRGQLA